VRYVLEGSVRRAGKHVRISTQFVDATTGRHHWAEKYDRVLGDIFAVQDEITRSVAPAIEPHLPAAEAPRALSRYSDDIEGWEFLARAQTFFWRMTRADNKMAVNPLEPAIATHPDYAPARDPLAFCLLFAFGRAVSLNPNSAAAHSHLSGGFAFAGRDREAIEHSEVAIRLVRLIRKCAVPRRDRAHYFPDDMSKQSSVPWKLSGYAPAFKGPDLCCA
jgi:hypothetical protein